MSRLKTWMQCPLQAHFKYDQKLPSRVNAKASFGRIIHHCLEILNLTNDLDQALEAFKDLWHNPEKLDATPDYWPKYTTYSSLRARGIEILQEHHEKHKWDSRQVLATEHRFLVPIGDHELTGVVDCLDLMRSGKGKDLLRIVDYKTSSRKPSMAELALDVQGTVYDYASRQPEFWLGNTEDFPAMTNGEWLWETLRDVPRRFIWYHLWGNAAIDGGSRDAEDFERLYRLMDQIARAVELEVFVPNISGESCGICDYVKECGLAIPTANELFEEEDAWI